MHNIQTQKLKPINPNFGAPGTVAVISGENFVARSQAVSDMKGIGAYKLIGTRVKLGDREINTYNTDESKNIVLEEFKSANANLVHISENKELSPRTE